MAHQTATTDGGVNTNHPAEDLATIVVDPDDIVAAFRRNRRDEQEQRSHVLKISPPFEGKQRATLHVSESHTYYPPEMDPKPIHLSPAAFLVGHTAGRRHPDWRDEWAAPDRSVERSLYRDEIPEAEQDDDEWEAWWETVEEMWEDRVRTALENTDELTLTSQHPETADTTVQLRVEHTDDG